MIYKTQKLALKLFMLGIGMMSVSLSYATTINFDLSGVGNTVNGFGRDGLYMGPGFNYGHTSPKYNWTFNTVSLSIDDVTGDGIISGNMTRNSNDSVWKVDINLSDLVVRTGTDSNTMRDDYNTSSHNLSDIFTSSSNGTGVEWKYLEMTVTQPSGRTLAWDGLAMPEIGHENVAEFYFHDNYLNSGIDGLMFDAWFQRSDCKYCRFQVGDSKAIGSQVSAVPIPGAAILFGSGLLGFFGISKRKT
ncbi:MAG: hypothetical protein V3V22_03450 [Methylococcales bacterium]